MSKRLYYLLCGLLGVVVMLLLVFLPTPNAAQTTPLEINLVAGNELGEYYSVARDLEKFAQTQNLGLDIDVIPTRGALQNIEDVFNYDSIPLGITQSDILAFLNSFANADEEKRRQAESLRAVMPLYEEEVHLITRQDINSVEELTDKRVSIGESGSGTSTTTSTLLYQLGVNPESLLTFDVKRSIEALRNNEIDGMFYVVGIPAQVLEKQIVADDNFHILPLALPEKPNDEFLARLYKKVEIPEDTYTWQTEAVETLGVKSFLFTTDRESCDRVTPIAQLITENLAWFQENGDPVWQQVNPEDLSQIDPERVSSCAVN